MFIEINGGIRTIEAIREHLNYVDGVMLGRVAYENPFLLTQVDQFVEGGKVNNISRGEVIQGLIDYVDRFGEDKRMGQLALKNVLGLFHNQKGSRLWRQIVSPPWGEGIFARDVLEKALKELPDEVMGEK